jgi:hypothetical protein
MSKNALEQANYYFEKAARLLDLPDYVIKQLETPHREIRVEITIVRDDGSIGTSLFGTMEDTIEESTETVSSTVPARRASGVGIPASANTSFA